MEVVVVEVHADRVSVRGPRDQLLEPTSLRVAAGQLAVVAGEPGAGHTAFGLAVTGRIKPTTGTVTPDAATLRAHSVLVNAPEVSEPVGVLALADVVAEELSLSGVRPSRATVRDWLARHALADRRRDRFETLPPATRIRVLTELAVSRPDTQLLVLDCPDRHTGSLQAWWPVALRYAERGLAVVALCTTATAISLPVHAARLGEHDQPRPLQVRDTTGVTP